MRCRPSRCARRRRVHRGRPVRRAPCVLRRFVVIGGAIALTGAGADEMYQVFAVNGLTALGVFMMALFLALFAWIALSFTSALAGFCSLLARRRLPAGYRSRCAGCRIWPRAPRC